ncbi:Cytochrome P450 2D9 [Halotydeus destructor]|nr:Cytochrome P450 2D9 [Halotydeus destructor]
MDVVLDFVIIYSIPILLTLTVTLWIYANNRRTPGPFGLPLIGYMPFLGRHPCQKLQSLRHRHGDVFAVNILNKNYYILNSFTAIKEAFKLDALNERPLGFSFFNEAYKYNSVGVLHGPTWLRHRKFVSTKMFSSTAARSAEDKMADILKELTDYIDSTKGQAENYHEPLSKTISNAVSSVLYSKKYDWDDPEFEILRQSVAKPLHALEGAGLVLEGQGFKFMMTTFYKSALDTILQFSSKGIEQLRAIAEDRLNNGLGQYGDFLDQYLDSHTKEQALNISSDSQEFPMDRMANTMYNLFQAGSDTTTETLYYVLYYMAKYTPIQRRVQEELDDVLESREFALSDKKDLPYTQATLEEILRLACLVPMGVARMAAQDVVVSGVKIPKGECVLSNLYASMMDPEIFPKPHLFRPQRFLDANGHFVANEANCQFSIGRRNCLGEKMARMIMFQAMVAILKMFTISLPEDQPEVKVKAGAFQILNQHKLHIVRRQR